MTRPNPATWTFTVPEGELVVTRNYTPAYDDGVGVTIWATDSAELNGEPVDMTLAVDLLAEEAIRRGMKGVP